MCKDGTCKDSLPVQYPPLPMLYPLGHDETKKRTVYVSNFQDCSTEVSHI